MTKTPGLGSGRLGGSENGWDPGANEDQHFGMILLSILPTPFLFRPNVVEKNIKAMRPEFSDKKLPPYAVCTQCGHFTHSLMDIKNRCSQVVNRKRCKGTYRPALMREDWNECPDCGRTGKVATGDCAHCAGVGWLYANRHPEPKPKAQPGQLDLFQNLNPAPRSNRGKG